MEFTPEEIKAIKNALWGELNQHFTGRVNKMKDLAYVNLEDFREVDLASTQTAFKRILEKEAEHLSITLPHYNDVKLEIGDRLKVDYRPTGCKDIIIEIIGFPSGMIDWIVINPDQFEGKNGILWGLEEPKKAFNEFYNVRWTK